MSHFSVESRGIWVFARPLQFGTIFGSQFVNHGKYPFCHWGVLVTSLDFGAAQRKLREIEREKDDLVLGTMWELVRDDNGLNKIDGRDFSVSNAKEQWNMFSAEFMGNSGLTDEQTLMETQRIMKQCPDFGLRENNYQKFVKYLLDSIYPNGFNPEIVTNILDRFLQMDATTTKSPFASPSKRLQIPSNLGPGGMMPALTSPRTAFFESLPASMEDMTIFERSSAWDDDADYYRPDEVNGLTTGLKDMKVR